MLSVLRLIDDVEFRLLHTDEILAAEFPVMPNLFDSKPTVTHLNKPVVNICLIYGIFVDQQRNNERHCKHYSKWTEIL